MNQSRNLKTCDRGHQFYKSSSCPVCPVCEAMNKPDTGFLAGISAPARRALTAAGIQSTEELARHTRSYILSLHGMGPNALSALDRKLEAQGLAFKPEP